MAETLTFNLRSQKLMRDEENRAYWEAEEKQKKIPAEKTAILICDMWDNHWSHGAALRVKEIAVRMNTVLEKARSKGVQIIFSPADVSDQYKGTPAYERIKETPLIDFPEIEEKEKVPAPIDDSDGGSDTNDGDENPKDWSKWKKQIEMLKIDSDRDVLSEDGQRIYSFLKHRKIEFVIIMGVHTNMCVLDRPFGIRKLIALGLDVALCRDLTDAMYNPAMPPYVSHEEGTRLVIEYIEKFYCPTVESSDLSEK